MASSPRKALKKITKKKTAPKKVKRVPITEEEYLETLIYYSKQAITGHGTSIDEFFQGQTDRLQKRLDDLRKAK